MLGKWPNRFLLLLLMNAAGRTWADDLITREYRLKHSDASIVIQVLQLAVSNSNGKRILAGAGSRLVVTDTIESQERIAGLLPVIDAPTVQTEPRRIQMEMFIRVSAYLGKQKKGQQLAGGSSTTPGASAGNPAEMAHSFDTWKSSQAYKSVYSDEDERLMRKPRVIHDDPVLPSLASLTLKGIFKPNTESPLALLSFQDKNFTARDGGLFEANRSRVKGVATRVYKDRVVLTGPDRLPQEIKFKTTL